MSSRYIPFEAIERMIEQMSHQFDRAATAWEIDAGPAGGRRMGIDLTDRDDEFVVGADLPGFEPEHVEVEMVGDALHVHAVHETDDEGGDEGGRWGYRKQRSLRGRVHVPAPVDADAAAATLKNGVLTVRLPKVDPEAGGGHTIDVE